MTYSHNIADFIRIVNTILINAIYYKKIVHNFQKQPALRHIKIDSIQNPEYNGYINVFSSSTAKDVSKILTNRQKKAQLTKQKILDEGKRLIASKPISSITVQDITRACGIAKGTFYCYFKSKEELCAHLALMPGADLIEAIKSDTALSLPERLRRYLVGRCSQIDEQDIDFVRNTQQFRMTASYREIRNQMFEGHYEHEAFLHIFREAIERKEVRDDLPADFLAQTIVYGIHGAIENSCLYDEGLHTAEWANEYADFLEAVVLKPYLI